jgi:hypothetical protein
MAAITLYEGEVITPEVLKKLYRKVEHELPSYARPIFLRLVPEEGFDPNKVSDPLFVINNISKIYVPLTLHG